MKLFPHQESIKEETSIGLFWDTGCGKTIGALAWAENKLKDRHILIISPASIIMQWKSECEKYYPEAKIKIIKGKEREYSGADIYIVSYETLKRDYKLIPLHFIQKTLIIADEGSKFKNSKTAIHKMMKYLTTKVAYKIILTATPLETEPMNIFNICSIISPTWMNWKTYTTRYVGWEEVWTGSRTISVPSYLINQEELRDRMKLISSRVKKEDVRKDLPPLSILWREVEPSKEQLRIQKQLNEYGFFETCTLLKSLDNGVNELLESDSDKLNEILIVPETPKKVRVLEEVMEEIEGQVIIFTQFVRSAKIIHEHFKTKYICEIVTGGDSERDDKVIKFKNGEIQMLITTDALSYGVDFPDVDYVINYDLPWNPAKLHQRTQRIYRINSKKGKTCINLIGGIIDNLAYEVLKERDAEFMFIIDGIGKTPKDSDITREIAQKYMQKGTKNST